MRYIACIFIFFFYLFSIELSFLPFMFRTFFALIGGIMLYKDRSAVSQYISKSKNWIIFIELLVLLVILAFISVLINLYFDPHFFKYPIQISITFFSAYFYIKVISHISRKLYLNEQDILKFFIWACAIQSVIAIFFFLQPQIRDAALGILRRSELGEMSLEDDNLNVRRLIGFGAAWFSGGTIFATAVLFSFVLLIRESKIIGVIKYFIIAVIIMVVGSMIARTALVGGVVAFFYLIISKGKLKNKIIVFQIIAILTVLLIFLYITYLEDDPVFELAFQRAFSLAYDFQSTGELSGLSGYTEKLYPNNLQTWILGDGKMADPLNPATGYYMGIDIGLSRVIFGLGISGLIIYSLIQFFMCKLTKLGTAEVVSLFVAYVVFMNKGLFSYDMVLAPFIMLQIHNSVITQKRGIRNSYKCNRQIQATH